MDFGQYLLREFFWELDNFEVSIPGLTDQPRNKIEVLSWVGYDAIRLRAGDEVYEARLDWSAKAPPVVVRLEERTLR